MDNQPQENKENSNLLNPGTKKTMFHIKNPKSILFRAINTKSQEPETPPFEIRPSEIVFHNTKENTVYEISFAVRNKTNKKLKIKLAKPLQGNFSLEYEEVTSVAPGLSLKAKMLYTCRKNKEIHSTFKVYTENYKMDIPVSAFPPCPFFIFDPIVDFEFVNLDDVVKKNIKIRNEGLKAGEISFKSRDPNVLRIEPRDIDLEAEEEKYVTVIFQSSKLGAYKNIIELEMMGHSIYKAIDFSANVVSNNAYVINSKGEEMHSLDCGLNLLGKLVRKRVILVNNSPNKLDFGISIIRGFHADDNEKTKLQTPMDMGRELTEKILTVEPTHGRILPYEKLDITLIFNSNIRDEDIVNSQKIAKACKYIVIQERVFEYTVMFDFNKKVESRCLLVSALTIPPQITFDKIAIDFGEILIKQKKTEKLKLKNWNKKLPITVYSPNEFYLHTVPKIITLQPLEEREIELIFTPKNMGIINKTVFFVVNKYFELPIKIFGVGIQKGQFGFKQNEMTRKREMRFKTNVEKVRQKLFYTEKIDTLKLPHIKTFNYFNKKEATVDKNSVMSRKFVPDPKNSLKELDSKPINNEQDWLCKQKLSGEQLMNIHAGPVELNFGKVFVKSATSLYFQIRNDLNNPIRAKIDIGDVYELRDSYLKNQIIPSGKTAGFKLTFNCHTTRKFKEKISYVINNHHVFNIIVIAEVIPVDLKINRSRIDFEFSSDSLDMNKSESIKLINKGNSDARFRVKVKENSAFSVDHVYGVVPVGKQFSLNVIYTPISDKDNDTIIIDIENGVEKLIECNGCAYETACELNTNHLNMGTIAIGQSKSSNFTLKNMSNKLCAIFKIDKNTIPPHLTLKPLIGKINPEDIQKFEIEFYSKKAIEFKNHEIEILVRGSKKIRLCFSVTTISPDIVIEEDCFDFQTITFGSKATLPMTITNHSSISAELYLQLFTKSSDLQEKYDCLEIDYQQGNNTNDSIVFEQVSEQYLKNHKNRSDQMTIHTNFNENDKDKRSYIFYLKPNRSYTYTLVFSPIKPGSYVFNLPFYIPGQETDPVIIKQIKCIGNNPKFLMEPFNGFIEFDRKIIISPESVIPEYKQLTISNPNFDESLVWNLDKEVLDNQKVFTVIPESGEIRSQQTMSLKIGFKPNKPQNFELSIPFYLSNDTMPYTEIKLKGEGAVPKLLFDSPEIIMPIVPLNMKSVQVINLYNDGYQNSNINAMMPQEYASLPLSIKFLNGSNIGVNNNKLKIEVAFSSNIPLSFTTRLDFEDDQKRIFSIYISGTTDNSLLTNFIYFINNPNYRFESDPKEGPVVVLEDTNDGDISITQSDAFSYHSNSQDETYKKYYRKLQTVCKSIKSWFKEYGIASIENYPEDVISMNGQQIFELIDFLIKNSLEKPDTTNTSKKNDKIKEQMESYLNLLNFLKEHNAMLNTLRPQYLLSYNDLLKYHSKLNNSNLHPNFYKLSEKRFKIISLTNWILLFNQIIKIFYINRITYKNYKNSFALLNDKPVNINPEYSVDKNSVYSVQELLMLRWLEVIQKNMTNESVKYLRFDQGLNNCIAIACALETYIQLDLRLVAKLKTKVHIKDEILYNFEKTRKLLIEYGVKDEITDVEFIEPNPINFLFIVLHLFKTLPNFLPRSVIDFNCTLQECIIKEIGFSNPANKPIIYSVKLFGHPNFKINSDTLKLEPRKNNSFAVEYYANTSLPAEGKIIFQNRRNGNSVAGAIVFDLRATVEKRFSIGYHPIKDINLYEVGNAEIEVFNPFDKDVDFKITLESLFIQEPIKNKKKTKVKKETKTLPFIPSFFLKQDRIWIRKNSKAKLYLTYLPITFENHRCHLIFLDPKVGEMQYEIEGLPKLPEAYQQPFTPKESIETITTINLTIPSKNNNLYSACTKLVDKLRECKMNEYIPTVTNIMQNTISSFDVSITPANFFIYNQTFNLFNLNKKDVLKNSQIQTNPLVLTPTNKNPVKDLQFKILLKDSNKIDIRLYEMNLTILPKTMKASIEMKTSARVPVVQEIPVSNPSSFDCTIKPSFKANVNGYLFDVSTSSFIVKQKSMETFKVKFYSDWVSKAEGILTLYNQLTNDTFEYFVKAEAEEPLSEDNIKMVTKAKTPCNLSFKVKNPIQDITNFTVDCDIPFSTFDKEIQLAYNEEMEFIVNFTPKNGGKFLNAVTFTAENGSYFWYLITLEIEAPASLRVFNIATEVRKPTVCKIEIDNTMPKEVDYEVVIQGDNLSGEQHITIEPSCKFIYNLIYYPFKIEERKSKIGFISKEEGELWFDINTKAEEAKPIKLSTLKAELGKSKNQTITLKNPLKKRPIHIKTYYNSNSNFYISHREFTIQPKQSFNVQITYMPRELHKNESELIVFSSSDLGDWKYMVFGIGIPPTDFEATTISSSIGKKASKTITFRNPFNNDINVNISLEGDEKNAKLFEILVPKNKNIIVSSLSNLQVIISFSPNVIKNYSTRLVIRLNDSIYWVYPILGVTEALTLNKEFILKTKCGNEVEKNLIYEIMGIDEINEDECFNYELSIKHKEMENIKKWLKIKTLKEKIERPNDSLSYLLNFQPYKPFKTNIDMIISKPSGGRWKVKIQLEALEPDYFEVINIVSQLNVKKVVQFRLFNNDSKHSSNFHAYFTQESDTEFSVEPQNGVLEPAIKEGTMIKISYLPVEYGKLKVGTLIIETESYMWKFLVKGAFQKYHPNKNKKKKSKTKILDG